MLLAFRYAFYFMSCMCILGLGMAFFLRDGSGRSSATAAVSKLNRTNLTGLERSMLRPAPAHRVTVRKNFVVIVLTKAHRSLSARY